jgi:Mn-dependent DtxR family transcriptional regulator
MVAQQTARLKDVQKAALEFRENCEIDGRSRRNREYRERELLALLESNPEIDVPSMAERMSLSTGMVYALLRNVKNRGVVSQEGYCGRWLISK